MQKPMYLITETLKSSTVEAVIFDEDSGHIFNKSGESMKISPERPMKKQALPMGLGFANFFLIGSIPEEGTTLNHADVKVPKKEPKPDPKK